MTFLGKESIVEICNDFSFFSSGISAEHMATWVKDRADIEVNVIYSDKIELKRFLTI